MEAYALDVLREQHLATADIGERTRETTYATLMADLEQEGRCLVIAGGEACKFLRGNNTCAIYPTRPNACVAMQAGDKQCQQARRAEGLTVLTCAGDCPHLWLSIRYVKHRHVTEDGRRILTENGGSTTRGPPRD